MFRELYSSKILIKMPDIEKLHIEDALDDNPQV
jgi:hypothetical protein